MYRNKTRHRRYSSGLSLVSAIFGLIMTTLPSISFAQSNVAWKSEEVYLYTDFCDVNDDATSQYSCQCGSSKKNYVEPPNGNPSYFVFEADWDPNKAKDTEGYCVQCEAGYYFGYIDPFSDVNNGFADCSNWNIGTGTCACTITVENESGSKICYPLKFVCTHNANQEDPTILWVNYQNPCNPCPAGTYSNQGDPYCTICPQGTYSGDGASSCSPTFAPTPYPTTAAPTSSTEAPTITAAPTIDCNSDSTYAGNVWWYNGEGMDPNKGVGAGWTLLSDGWDSNTKSMEVNWDIGPDYNPPCVVIGLKDGSIWFYNCMNPYWYQLQAPIGYDVTLWTLKAQFIDNGDDTLTVTVIAALEMPQSYTNPYRLFYGKWTTSLCGISGDSSAIVTLNGPAQFLEVQWPDLESTSQLQYFKIVAGVGCDAEFAKSNYNHCPGAYCSISNNGKSWMDNGNCEYCSQCTGTCDPSTEENCGNVWFNGDFNPNDPTSGWSNLGRPGGGTGNPIAAMKVGFTGTDYYPAIVVAFMAFDIYYWNYANQNGGWEEVHSNTNYCQNSVENVYCYSWYLPITVEVQFPFENSDGYLRVVSSGLLNGILYYNAQAGVAGLSSPNWELTSYLPYAEVSDLCVNFGGYDSNVTSFPIVVAGYMWSASNCLTDAIGCTGSSGDVVIWQSVDDAIYLPIGNSITDDFTSGDYWQYGVVGMQCSWENFPTNIYPEILVSYNNASGYYYNPTPISTGCPCSNENGASNTCPCLNGNFTSFAGPTWDDTFMSVFNSSFPTPGSPRLVGGLTQIPPGSGILSWLECEVCKSAVGTIMVWAGGEFTKAWCDSICASAVEAVGGGPEDPVADFVVFFCPYICKEMEEYIVEESVGELVCGNTGVGLCTKNSCGSGSTSTTLVQSDTFTLDIFVGKQSRQLKKKRKKSPETDADERILDTIDEKGTKADKSEATAGKSSMASQSALEVVLQLNLRKCDDTPQMTPMSAELVMPPCQKVGKRSRRVNEYHCEFHLEFNITDVEHSEEDAKEISNDCIKSTLQQTDVLNEISAATGSHDFVIRDEDDGEIVSYKISKSKNSSTNEATKAGKDGKSSQAEAMALRHRTREHTKSAKMEK
jgi:hypothetical protein